VLDNECVRYIQGVASQGTLELESVLANRERSKHQIEAVAHREIAYKAESALTSLKERESIWA
jgi:hypothetical protein